MKTSHRVLAYASSLFVVVLMVAAIFITFGHIPNYMPFLFEVDLTRGLFGTLCLLMLNLSIAMLVSYVVILSVVFPIVCREIGYKQALQDLLRGMRRGLNNPFYFLEKEIDNGRGDKR